jgi:hypothetical protein
MFLLPDVGLISFGGAGRGSRWFFLLFIDKTKVRPRRLEQGKAHANVQQSEIFDSKGGPEWVQRCEMKPVLVLRLVYLDDYLHVTHASLPHAIYSPAFF